MRKTLQTLALSAVIFGSAAAADAQVNFGIHIGAPPAPRAYHVPAQPGPDYIWIEGYQYPQSGHYMWHNGYWTRPPYEGAYWVAPYHVGGQYYTGHWEGDHGHFNHSHQWDRSHQRDDKRYHGNNGRGRGRQ